MQFVIEEIRALSAYLTCIWRHKDPGKCVIQKGVQENAMSVVDEMKE